MRTAFTFILLLLCSIINAQEVYHGKVIAVADGDTFTILDYDNNKTKVRVYGIDAPEKSQPFGQKARQALSSKIFGRYVTLHDFDTDKYGRHLCKVFVNSTDIGLEMISEGYAWHYSYFYDSETYANAMERAKKNKTGLWSDPHAMNPREWRIAHKN